MFPNTSRLTAVLLTATLLLTGCVKIRLTVQLNEDGSGQVVEDLVFGEKLVDAAQRLKDLPSIEELTSDEHLRQRVKHMGSGVRFVGKKVEKQTDGSIRLVVTYAFADINDVKLAPIPFGPGWENLHLAFAFRADTSLAAEYFLNIRWNTAAGKDRGHAEKPDLPPLSEREAQQIRQLLPVFKDLLTDFELRLRLEVYDPKQWASVTRGHLTSYRNNLSQNGGRLNVFQITDKHLLGSDDGLMVVVPWRQIGRELDLERGSDGHRGPQLLPHVSFYDRGSYSFGWRAIQTPRGREYY